MPLRPLVSLPLYPRKLRRFRGSQSSSGGQDLPGKSLPSAPSVGARDLFGDPFHSRRKPFSQFQSRRRRVPSRSKRRRRLNRQGRNDLLREKRFFLLDRTRPLPGRG